MGPRFRDGRPPAACCCPTPQARCQAPWQICSRWRPSPEGSCRMSWDRSLGASAAGTGLLAWSSLTVINESRHSAPIDRMMCLRGQARLLSTAASPDVAERPVSLPLHRDQDVCGRISTKQGGGPLNLGKAAAV